MKKRVSRVYMLSWLRDTLIIKALLMSWHQPVLLQHHFHLWMSLQCIRMMLIVVVQKSVSTQNVSSTVTCNYCFLKWVADTSTMTVSASDEFYARVTQKVITQPRAQNSVFVSAKYVKKERKTQFLQKTLCSCKKRTQSSVFVSAKYVKKERKTQFLQKTLCSCKKRPQNSVFVSAKYVKKERKTCFLQTTLFVSAKYANFSFLLVASMQNISHNVTFCRHSQQAKGKCWETNFFNWWK